MRLVSEMRERRSPPMLESALLALRRPRGLAFRLKMIASNSYFRQRRVTWLSELTGAGPGLIRKYVAEIEEDAEFVAAVRAAFRMYCEYMALPTDFMVAPNGSTMFFHGVSQYVLVRVMRPSVILETGGTPGKSSAFMLRALERNEAGRLITIDQPPQEILSRIRVSEIHSKRPASVESNWCVPVWLRDRQKVVLGRAEDHLPRVLSELREIDMFIHDSDHSYAHMQWELKTACPFVRSDGVVWCDDIRTNDAWRDFCHDHRLRPLNFTSVGVARKRLAGNALQAQSGGVRGSVLITTGQGSA